MRSVNSLSIRSVTTVQSHILTFALTLTWQNIRRYLMFSFSFEPCDWNKSIRRTKNGWSLFIKGKIIQEKLQVLLVLGLSSLPWCLTNLQEQTSFNLQFTLQSFKLMHHTPALIFVLQATNFMQRVRFNKTLKYSQPSVFIALLEWEKPVSFMIGNPS